jgi:hypothetical protein
MTRQRLDGDHRCAEGRERGAGRAPHHLERGVTGPAITFDTGALIALERRKDRAMKVYTHARDRGLVVATPNVTLAEW